MKSKINKVQLVKDTIDKEDIHDLIGWLKTNPKLTKGEYTTKFEDLWSKYTGVKYSVYVNSGSSANLAMAYALKISGRLKNLKVLAPAVSWVTTISPFLQLGYNVKLYDSDRDTLGPDIDNLKELIKDFKPSILILVHVLGFPAKMKEIINLCEENNIILLEDSCESVGSTYNKIKTGTFGLMSSFSFYFAHHISTIEGGMICTNDHDLYNLLKSIRAHGWDRDLDLEYKEKLRNKYLIDEFKSLYTFYYPGFNLRSTDLQAFIGIRQMDKLENIVQIRNRNFLLYDELIKNSYWKINPTPESFVSAFAYPIITPKLEQLLDTLKNKNIETRPLICGSISNQPFWLDKKGKTSDFYMAEEVDKYGCYLPINHQMTEDEVVYVCDTVNKIL